MTRSTSTTRASTTCKNIDVDIPRDKFTVITGVSGSGKSTLAFDILFAEGQRRYLESLNAYARQFVQPASRPDVDAIFGIPPTVAIEQRTSRGGRKSTVATLTEIYHFLRLLFVKLGTQYCPDCDVPIEPQSADAIVARASCGSSRGRGSRCSRRWSSTARAIYTDLAKWARGKGYTHLRVDGEFLPTAKWPRLDRFREHTIELPVAELDVAPREREGAARRGRAARSSSARACCTCCCRRLGRTRDARSFSREARVPARAGAASPSSIRASSRTTRSTAGAPRATAPA